MHSILVLADLVSHRAAKSFPVSVRVRLFRPWPPTVTTGIPLGPASCLQGTKSKLYQRVVSEQPFEASMREGGVTPPHRFSALQVSLIRAATDYSEQTAVSY